MGQALRWIIRIFTLIEFKFTFALLLFIFVGVHSTSVMAVDTALVLRGSSDAMKEMFIGMSEDLEGEINFTEYEISPSMNEAVIANLIRKDNPSVVVLLGNKSISLYKKYYQSNESAKKLPSILMAALYVDTYFDVLKHSQAIRYEIPAVTSILKLRTIVDAPITRVGVIHRAKMRDFVEQNRTYCEAEGIELVSMQIGNNEKSYVKIIKKNIKKLKKMEVDAYWILNDNVLLSADVIVNAWIPGLRKSNKSVIVGVENLAETKFKFGTFAIVPDSYALGVQGAGVLADIMDEDWALNPSSVEQPVSVKKVLNYVLSKEKKIPIKEKSLNEMDRVIKQ